MLQHFRLQAIVLCLCVAYPLSISSANNFFIKVGWNSHDEFSFVSVFCKNMLVSSQNTYSSKLDGQSSKTCSQYPPKYAITDTATFHNNNINGLSETFRFEKEIHDLFFVENFALKHLANLNHQGHLLARTDSISIVDNAYILYIFRGGQFFYVLNAGNLGYLELIPLKLDFTIFDRPVSFQEFEETSKIILEHLQNIGYPFAKIYKTDILIKDPYIHATLQLDKQDLFTFARAEIPNDVNLSQSFVSNLLGFREGEPYSESIVLNSADKLKNLPFAKLDGSIKVRFVQQQAFVILPLSPVRSNRFDGIAGVVGGNGENEPIQVTGSLDLYLVNSFGHGEFLDVSWQAPGHQTQLLELNGGFPFPAGLPVKPEIDFLLHKQDTTWIRMHYRPVINFNSGSAITFGVFAQIDQNNLLSTGRYQTPNTPMRNLDFRKRLYGAQFLYMTPGFANDLAQAGNRFELSLSAGHQNISRNYSLPQNIYEGITMQRTLYEVQFGLEKRFLLAPGIRWEISGKGILNNGNDLFENQLIRLGGLSTLKGFDELSLLASSYIFGNTELRFYASDRTFFSGFINGGWFERKLSGEYYNNFPVGVGAGLNLETQAGILALYFAVGAQRNIPPQLRNSKIHIGYTTIF